MELQEFYLKAKQLANGFIMIRATLMNAKLINNNVSLKMKC